MKKLHWIILVLITMGWGFTAWAETTAPETMGPPNLEANNLTKTLTLKVMTFNIRYGKGWDERWDLERTAAVIREANPDLVGIQEVDREWSSRSQFKDIISELAERLGMFYVFGPAMDKAPGFPGGKFGNAILSRYPLEETWSKSLPGEGMGRGLVGARIRLEGYPVTMITTHLGLSSMDRLFQVMDILTFLEQISDPMIITGDWNALPGAEEVRLMANRFLDVQAVSGQETIGTFLQKDNGARPRIDYIFASPEFGVERTDVIETNASDHLPITTVLTLIEERSY